MSGDNGLLEHVQKLYKDKGLDACWKWAMDGKGSQEKADRFNALARFAALKRDDGVGQDAEAWAKRRKLYGNRRDRFQKKADANEPDDDLEWPASINVAELLYHSPPHCHFATAERNKLITVCNIAEQKWGLYVGEFPPFDTVDCVHVSGSWHYRDSGSPGTPRTCSGRGDGLAADINGTREVEFYNELVRRYR